MQGATVDDRDSDMGKGAVYHDNRERVDKSGVIFLVEWSIRNLAGTISLRNFERFTREVGTTPSQYVLQMRVEAARREIERYLERP
jgi:hypothetical protein